MLLDNKVTHNVSWNMMTEDNKINELIQPQGKLYRRVGESLLWLNTQTSPEQKSFATSSAC